MTSLTILITGAGSGLGRGLALDLAGRGHFILCTDVHGEAAQSVADEIKRAGGRAEAARLDVASDESVGDYIRLLGTRPVEVLINNAGLQHLAPVEAFESAQWDRLMNVMVHGTFRMTRAVLPGMRARGFGRILHIGSIHSLVASPHKSAYVAAKHAILGFSKVVALETADGDITSNSICPAYLETPLVVAQVAEQARLRCIPESEVAARVFLGPMPKKVFITAAEVAAAVAYLMSPEARNVTGQTLTIDGGWTAQ